MKTNKSNNLNLNTGRSAKRLADAAKRIGSSTLVTPHALCAYDTATTSLAKAAKHPIVTDISDERATGDGVWIYLADGWTCGNTDTGSIHEDTIAEALACLKRARYVAENTDEAQAAAVESTPARKAYEAAQARVKAATASYNPRDEASRNEQRDAVAALLAAEAALKAAGVSPIQRAVEAFVAAFVAFKVSTPDNRAAADAALDAAIVGYRKAHRMSDAMGFLDLVNHYNATYASAQQ